MYKPKINPSMHHKKRVSIDPFDRIMCSVCERMRFKKFMILEMGNWMCPERDVCNAIWNHKLKVKTKLEKENKKNIVSLLKK